MVYLKTGDSLVLQVVRKDNEGNPQTGDAAFLFSQIRDECDLLIADFTIVETAILGTYEFTVPFSETVSFPLGTLYFDIEYNDGILVNSSETVLLLVSKDVTNYE